jgi:DNA invertase Pin-like site-specific DNA recombinase
MTAVKRVAVYVRVSTSDQTCENQKRELRAWTRAAGHKVVCVFEDSGISGAYGLDKRPGFNAMLKAAVKREFDILAVWSSDRIGRSMPDLLEVLQTIRSTGTQLYLHTQGLDTTTPSGRALYQMLGVFSELEREMIVARVNAGIARARQQGTRSGKPIGRPKVSDAKERAIRAELAKGTGILKTARKLGVGTGTVQRIVNST